MNHLPFFVRLLLSMMCFVTSAVNTLVKLRLCDIQHRSLLLLYSISFVVSAVVVESVVAK